MTLITIFQNLLLSIIVSSAIGLNREYKDSPAGLRTYNLVCLGAVIITMSAKELSEVAVQQAFLHPEMKEVFTVDTTKIIGEIVSGIGFLGAGTIIFSQKKIRGLSTASSIWVTAALGITIGLQYYRLAIIGMILTVIILATFNKIWSDRMLQQLSVTFTDERIEDEITNCLHQYDLSIKKIDTKIFSNNETKMINNIYTIKPNKELDLHLMILKLGKLTNISDVEMIEED